MVMSHSNAVLIMLALALPCCVDDDEEIESQRHALHERRLARWNSTYAPYIKAACRDDLQSLQCAKARMDAQRMYQEEEDRGTAMRAQASHDAAMRDEARRDRVGRAYNAAIRNANDNAHRNRPITCSTSFGVTTCN